MAKAAPSATSDIGPLLAVANATGGTVAEVETALAGARKAVETATAEHGAADREYRTGLLTLDETGLRKLIDAKSAATVRRDRAAALIEALERRLADIRETDAEADRKARYVDAQRQAKEAASLLNAYPGMVDKLITLLRPVNVAELAVEAANADLPRGAEPIASPEFTVRGSPHRPRKVLSEQSVELWCMEGSGVPVPEEYQGQIQGGRRTVPHTGHPHHPSSTETARYQRRHFLKRTFLPEQLAFHPLPLATDIRLPAFADGVFALDCSGIVFQTDVASCLAEAKPILPDDDPRADVRKPVVEFEFVPAATAAKAVAA